MEMITAGVKNLHLDSKFVSVGDKDHRFFNATSIAKLFTDTPRKASMLLQQYNRREDTKACKSALKSRLHKVAELTASGDNLLIIERKIRGFYSSKSWYNGTWFHFDLLEHFLNYAMDSDDFYTLKFEGYFNKPSIKLNYKSVYLLLCDDGSIKIGISSNPENRINSVLRASGRKHKESFFTVKISNAYKIEQMLLGFFHKHKTNGEWIEGVDFIKVIGALHDLLIDEYMDRVKVTRLIDGVYTWK